MAKRINISIEGDQVKVLYATKRGRRYIVNDLLSFHYNELSSYLQEEKSKEFYLCVSFKEFFQANFYLPPARKSHLKRLIETEIRKNIGPDTEFIYTYFELGTKIVEGKEKTEVFTIAVLQKEADMYLELFKQHNKKVKCLFPDFLALLNILPETDHPVLYIYPKESERVMFIVQKGKLLFYRSFSAISEIIDDIDIQNINLTINYARQRISTAPEFAVLIGDPPFSETVSQQPVVPIASIRMPSNIDLRGIKATHKISEYVLPLSLLQKWKKEDFLPKQYRYEYYLKSYLKAASLFFAILSLTLIAMSGMTLNNIKNNHREISFLRTSLNNLDSTLRELQALDSQYQKYQIAKELLVKYRTSPSPFPLLLMLPEIDLKDIEIHYIKIDSPVDNTLSFTLEGTVNVATYTEVEHRVQGFSNQLRNLKGLQIKGVNYNLKSHEFKIEGIYSGLP